MSQGKMGKDGVVPQASGFGVEGFGKGRMGAETPGTSNAGEVITSGLKMPNNASNQVAQQKGGNSGK
jgi:hypothetical protein